MKKKGKDMGEVAAIFAKQSQTEWSNVKHNMKEVFYIQYILRLNNKWHSILDLIVTVSHRQLQIYTDHKSDKNKQAARTKALHKPNQIIISMAVRYEFS